jgi:DNA topoisomerase-1
MSEGDELSATKLDPQGHSTTPPPRFTEATLVRALEERGIGRPSTYASILGTILDRGYVFKKGTALVPSFLAFAVVALLERHFTQLVDYDFTARMEDDLDRIADGDEERVAWLRRFYFGSDGDEGLHDLVTHQLGEIDAREINTIEIGDGIALRIGRYGPYLERGEDRVSVPDDIAPDELTVEKAQELLERAGGEERPLGVNAETGRRVVLRAGRYGPYVAELPEEGSEEKPRTASLFQSMSAETLTLEDALRLLSLPRTLGAAPDGEEITAQNGRYGPYIQKEKETRSLESEEEIFTISLERALELLSQPKQRRRRGQAQGPLRELGADPGSGKSITVRSGRFGPYVTDGETNASLRKGDDPESVTLERAVELIAERRAKGPSKPRRRARSTS